MPRVVEFDVTGGPDVLHIVDRPIERLCADEVRVRVEAIGVNRLDGLARQGTAPRSLRLPGARLGVEASGVVDDIGADVADFAVGDAVIVAAVPDWDINGTYADFVTVPDKAVIARPVGIDAVSAAGLWVTYSTAYGALIETARLRPGDHLLVTAASSGVGLAAIQIANQIGAVPIAVTRHTHKKDALIAAGASAAIATDHDDLIEIVHAITKGGGADVALDLVGGPGFAELAEATKFSSGTIVVVGQLDGRPAVIPNRPLTIHRYTSYTHTTDPAAVRRIAAFLTAGLRAGVVRPIIDTVYTLEQIVEAHRHLDSGNLFGKLIVTT